MHDAMLLHALGGGGCLGRRGFTQQQPHNARPQDDTQNEDAFSREARRQAALNQQQAMDVEAQATPSSKAAGATQEVPPATSGPQQPGSGSLGGLGELAPERQLTLQFSGLSAWVSSVEVEVQRCM